MKAWKMAVIVGMVTILAVGVGVVFAQGEDPNPPTDETHPCWGRGPFGRHLGPVGDERGELHDLMFSALADALGLSVEELEAQLESEGGLLAVATAQGLSEEDAQALFEEVRANALEEAVDQGLIDEEQAQLMLEHDQGFGRGMRGPFGEGPFMEGERGELHDLMFSALADALGLSVEELEAQLESERGMMAVALAQGLTEEDAQALFEEARTNALEEAVEQGLIDEELAERMLEHDLGSGPGMRGPHGDGQKPGGRGRRGPFGLNGSDE